MGDREAVPRVVEAPTKDLIDLLILLENRKHLTDSKNGEETSEMDSVLLRCLARCQYLKTPVTAKE